LKYLSHTKKQSLKGQEKMIDENYYPKSNVNSVRKAQIDSILDYIELIVKRTTHRLTKLII
jgi:hypothetical protein